MTDRHAQVIEFIRSYVAENGYPPTTREIGDGVGLSSTASVHNCLKQMESLGYIKVKPNSVRAITILVKEGQ
jgi:repressor LexA